MKKNILITGIPRSGKSTLLKKLIAEVDQKVGFVTNEVLKDGERIGFELENHKGKRSTLADVGFKTNFKVARYFVDINNLDEIVSSVDKFEDGDLLFIDEIGQMQLFSEKFKTFVTKFFDSKNTCVATISKVYSDEFIETIKKRDDIILIEINQENRESKEKYLKRLLAEIPA